MLAPLLAQNKGRWLVTGAAGFIGSHLAHTLLAHGQEVVGLDNFATGHRRNLPEVSERFRFIEGDIADLSACQKATEGVRWVLHQAALGSVPRSIKDPLASHRANVDGFINMLTAARDAGAARFVYASSSSVYGDDPRLPKREAETGRVLSPYAATKAINELYARVFERTYGIQTVGLRYFNVFGPRQDPNGPYAAVIPRWLAALAEGKPVEIYGDGRTSRDFCFVANAVQANLLAALKVGAVSDTVYNVSVGGKTSLSELFGLLRDRVAAIRPAAATAAPVHLPERVGDIRDSQADINHIQRALGYEPTHSVGQGLDETVRAFFA
jgi:UDP-N-acetylglucosamine/UDP-N-acetylgalactosamine 4-epimerase